MRLSRYGKKTVSVLLACAMLGTSFAQYAFAEDAAETDVVLEQETQADAAEVEAVEEAQQEDVVIDADAELAEEQESAEESAGVDETAEIAGETAEEEPSFEIESISALQGPVATIAEGMTEKEEGLFKYMEEGDSATITGLVNTETTALENFTIPDTIGEGKLPVTKIAANAFTGKNFTGAFKLSQNLEEIGASAFANCSWEGGLDLRKTKIETIGAQAFANGIFEGGLELPTSLMFIGDSAFIKSNFTGTLGLTTGIIEIGDSAFEGCTGFDGKLEILNNVSYIGDSAFKGCSGFEALSFAGTEIRYIGKSAFEDCTGLAGALVIPDGVTGIGANAFKNCGALTALTLPNGLDAIGNYAFYRCVLLAGALAIPDSVTEIGDYAFDGCKGFSSLKLPETSLVEIGNYAFNGCTGLTGDLVLSSGLTMVGAQAFNGCSGFTGKLDLSACGNLEQIGEKAFYGCSGFNETLTFPTSQIEIGKEAFNGCSGFVGNLDLSNCTAIGSQAFYGCSGFDGTLTLPGNKENIAKDAVFGSICMADGDTPVEVQAGDTEGETLQVRAGNSKLILAEDLVTWSSDDGTIATVDGSGKVIGVNVGTTTVTATVTYNGLTAKKTVNVIAAAGIPTIESAGFDPAVLKPGTIVLTVDIKSNNKGIRTLTGYFAHSTTGQQIPFSADWTEAPVFSGEQEIDVEVPSAVAEGDYYLSYLALTNTDSVSTTYAYDPAAKLWKTNRGSQVSIEITNTDEKKMLTVTDGFGKTEGGIDAYITTEGLETRLANLGSGKTAVIQYDAKQHIVPAEWFEAIRGRDVTLALTSTDGAVAWCFYGMDIEEEKIKEIDCLVSAAAADISVYGNAAAGVAAQFVAANGELPGKATVRVSAAYASSMAQQTGKLYLYSVNANNTLNKGGTPSYVMNDGKYWYEFEVTDNTIPKLLLSGQELALTPSYKVTSIVLSASKLAVAKGKTAVLTAAVGPVGAVNKAIVWSSSNKKVAKVSASGKITGKKYGKATITATAADGSGVVAKCKVTVGYRIKYKLKGGKNNASNPKAYYKQKIKLKNPTRTGYKFQGWYTDKNYKHRIKTIPKSYKKNLTLYAKWKKK